MFVDGGLVHELVNLPLPSPKNTVIADCAYVFGSVVWTMTTSSFVSSCSRACFGLTGNTVALLAAPASPVTPDRRAAPANDCWKSVVHPAFVSDATVIVPVES